jgi:uncharacterized protein
MRICFTSDLHGDAGLYEQLEQLLRAATPDLLILGGDLLVDGECADPVGTQVASLERELMPRVAAWRAAAPRLQVACILGNHEWACTRDALQVHHDAGRIILLDHERNGQHEGFALVGYSSTPPTPHWVKDFERLDQAGDPLPHFPGWAWDPKDRVAREVDLAEHFNGRRSISQELESAPRCTEPCILVAHTPPYDSKLDRLPKVTYPIGSRAVRRFIEQRQPVCSLHGHVHDSPGVTGCYSERLGSTLAINPGQSHTRLHAVVFDARRPAETLRHTVYT